MKNLNNYKKFMLESNRIEGEDRLNPGDLEAVEFTLLSELSCIQDLYTVHSILGKYLKESWVGHFRQCEVQVGNYYPPKAKDVYDLMVDYFKDYFFMSSWVAHNEFERIHPFQDLNGRVGRLIWLSKAINEGYNFKLSFLQAYYYQTLKTTR